MWERLAVVLERQKRQPRRGQRRLIRKGFSLVALLSLHATFQYTTTRSTLVEEAGGGGRVLKKEPQSQERR